MQVREREGLGTIPRSLTLAEWRAMVWSSEVKSELGQLAICSSRETSAHISISS